MHHEGNIIRPPSEADSILLEVCVGCPRNCCSFCGAYLADRFRVKDEATVFADIDYAARRLTRLRRVFLCGGDALALPFARLERILLRLREAMPRLTRVSSYASAQSIAGKSPQQLDRLRELGLGMLHMGLESGDDAVLARMNKGLTVTDMLEASAKARQAGMKLSVTVIVGLGGEEGWLDHARLTGQALTAMNPDHAAALCLIPVPGTALWQDVQAGRFRLPGAVGMARELREMLAHTDMTRGLFLADHASNYVPLKLRMPRDKQAGLDLLDAALAGEAAFRPERSRRL